MSFDQIVASRTQETILEEMGESAEAPKAPRRRRGGVTAHPRLFDEPDA